jgi:hypothetical protein
MQPTSCTHNQLTLLETNWIEGTSDASSSVAVRSSKAVKTPRSMTEGTHLYHWLLLVAAALPNSGMQPVTHPSRLPTRTYTRQETMDLWVTCSGEAGWVKLFE